MRKIWMLLGIICAVSILAFPSIVLAGDGECEGDGCGDSGCVDGDCDRKVKINVSRDSEVEVNTGDNSEVSVNTGDCNDVYLNGKDINDPVAVYHTTNVGYSGALLSQRISQLDYWRQDAQGTIQLVADGLAKLIVGYESGQITTEDMQEQLAILENAITSLEGRYGIVLANQDSFYNDLVAQQAEYLALINALAAQVDYLKALVAYHQTNTIWWIIGLVAAVSILGGLLYKRTKR